MPSAVGRCRMLRAHRLPFDFPSQRRRGSMSLLVVRTDQASINGTGTPTRTRAHTGMTALLLCGLVPLEQCKRHRAAPPVSAGCRRRAGRRLGEDVCASAVFRSRQQRIDLRVRCNVYESEARITCTTQDARSTPRGEPSWNVARTNRIPTIGLALPGGLLLGTHGTITDDAIGFRQC